MIKGTVAANPEIRGSVAVGGTREPKLEDRTFTENGAYTPNEGYDGIRNVTVDVEGGGGIPDGYADVSGVTATADKVLDGSVFVDSTGAEKEGTMPNNGAISETMDGIDTKSVSIPKGYTSGGTVSLTDDIDNEVTEQADLISQIQTSLAGKTAGSGDGIVPSGTKTITENGVHDVTTYASANVAVEPDLEELSVTENGTYTPSADGYSKVTVEVEPDLQEKSVTPTKSAQTVSPDSGYDGLSKVSVGAIPDSYIIPSGTKSITTNGTHDVTDYASAEVAVPVPTLQSSKTVTPTTSEQTVSPDSGYDAMEKVVVEAVHTVEVAVPTVTINKTTGVVSAQTEQGEGYVSESSPCATLSLPTHAGGTVEATSEEQTIVSGGTYMLNDLILAAASSGGGGGGTLSVTTYTSVEVSYNVGFWSIPIADTDGLVGVYMVPQFEQITDCAYGSGTNLITSMFFLIGDTTEYFSITTSHPIFGMYGATVNSNGSGSAILISDTGVQFANANINLSNYENTNNKWNVYAIYSK